MTRSDQEIEHLIKRVRSGEAAAQRELWRELSPELCRVCRRVVRNDARGDEVAAEVIADFLLRHVHRLEHPRAAWSYLKLIAVRRAAKARTIETAPPIDAIQEAVDRSDLEERMWSTSMLPRLDECLDKLTPKARQALALRYGTEHTTEQIGTLLGGSKQYIGRLITQCLEKLRRCLEQQTNKRKAQANRQGATWP